MIIITGLSIISCSSEDSSSGNEIPDGNNEEYQKLVIITSTITDSEEIESTTELTYNNDNLLRVKEIYDGIGENIWNLVKFGKIENILNPSENQNLKSLTLENKIWIWTKILGFIDFRV